MSAAAGAERIVHASCAAVGDRALLITGASGRGKSSLCLEMMARGALLVSDDRVCLQVRHGVLIASAPDSISGLIEARGVGILRADTMTEAQVCAVVDLDQTETGRLPSRHVTHLLDVRVPLFHDPGLPHFAAALVQFLKRGLYDGA